MASSKASRAEFPVWVRCTVGLVSVSCFPCVVIASCLGVVLPWAAFAVGGGISYQALRIMVRGNIASEAPLLLLATRLLDAHESWNHNREIVRSQVGKNERGAA